MHNHEPRLRSKLRCIRALAERDIVCSLQKLSGKECCLSVINASQIKRQLNRTFQGFSLACRQIYCFLISARDTYCFSGCSLTYLENINRNLGVMGRKLPSPGMRQQLSWGFEDLHFGLRCLQ